MRAYAFLGAGAVDYLSGLRWPTPAGGVPGAWLEAAAEGVGVRACVAEHLPWWLDVELWEVELAGEVRDSGRSLSAERGRLLRSIDAWSPGVAQELVAACAQLVRERALAALEEEGREHEAAALAASDDPAVIERAAAAAAAGRAGEASALAGFTADVVRYARDARDPARGASVAAYVTAHALAGGDERRPGYEEAFEAERRRQASWLIARLAL